MDKGLPISLMIIVSGQNEKGIISPESFPSLTSSMRMIVNFSRRSKSVKLSHSEGVIIGADKVNIALWNS
jgi:hypothetical protein